MKKENNISVVFIIIILLVILILAFIGLFNLLGYDISYEKGYKQAIHDAKMLNVDYEQGYEDGYADGYKKANLNKIDSENDEEYYYEDNDEKDYVWNW